MALPESKQSRRYTVEEYLEIERESTEIKHEYANGEMIAMTGASNNHNIIAGNIITLFNMLLRDTPCIIHPGDSRVKIPGKTSYRYPDVVVTCDEPQFDDNVPPSLLNPTVLVEVLSPSTAYHDHIQKREEYINIPTLKAYLLVSQDMPKVEYHLRDPQTDFWRYSIVSSRSATVVLPDPACTLPLTEIYLKVKV